ncbi:glycosyltransferase [Marinobacter sp. SS5-14b]|uniref:glycosyltransferase family 2 protein n=1 Tax=Marinobacter sp. SS5-14b TaxID=3050456 RepID=UPI0026DF06FD|nr:glycosyltransferase [Marinobacter sp. SS5-14b]
MKTLREFYQEHQGKVSDKWSLYLDEYDRIFQPYRDRPVRLLEIGIQNGGSLEIWSQYFDQAMSLVGCDINEKCKALKYDDERVSVIVENANTDSAEQAILTESSTFDIIIDDGSHTSEDIVHSFSRYFPHLNEGGVFVAEDLHCSYWQEFGGGLFDPYSSMSFFKHLADLVNFEHWGVEMDRSELLDLFADKYQVRFSEEQLASIHSVEFINSICVVRKRPLVENLLGTRHVVGSDAAVVSGLNESTAPNAVEFSQKSNPHSNNALHPALEMAALKQDVRNLEAEIDIANRQLAEANTNVAELGAHLAQSNQTIDDLISSTSWKLTFPVRMSGKVFRKPIRLIRMVFAAIALAGGVKPALRKAQNLWRSEGLQGLLRGYNHVATRSSDLGYRQRNDYHKWLSEFEASAAFSISEMEQEIRALPHKPLLSIVMPVYNANIAWLDEAIESVRAQNYENWELCIADDHSTDPELSRYLAAKQTDDSRIKVVSRKENGHISAASNSALSVASGDWVLLLDQDDLLSEQALYRVVKAIQDNPDAKLFYSDEDKISEAGERHNPYFKCDWNRSLFYSQNMICHLGVYQRNIVKDIGGFREGFEGAQDHDLALRFIESIDDSQIVHIPHVLYHWRVHSSSTAGGADAKPYAALAGERAIQEHLDRLNVSAKVTSNAYGYRVQYLLPEVLPLISLIIPTRNGLDLVRTCIESIVQKTSYPNYEIILVDNGSDDPKCLEYFATVEDQYSFIRVKRDDRPFNYSALNNTAVSEANGEIIGLINNDIEVIEPNWLSEMVGVVVQPDVGAVGAKLLYPDNTVQHAGVVIGIGGVAGHVHLNYHRDDVGYFCRLNVTNEYSAVTAACLLVKKSDFEKVGGLNEEDLTVAFNDVDFCLKLKEMGLRNVWTPYALLYHHESATRGYEDSPEKVARFNKEANYMMRKWGKYIAHDPCYSPNLSLTASDFSLAWPPRR